MPTISRTSRRHYRWRPASVTEAERGERGFPDSDFNPVLVKRSLEISKAYGKAGDLYGVPLDAHTFVLYYNKDIPEAGRPPRCRRQSDWPHGSRQLHRSPPEDSRASPAARPLACPRRSDPASVGAWGTPCTNSSGGGGASVGGKLNLDKIDTVGKKALQTMVDWAQRALLTPNISYAADVALFSLQEASGRWQLGSPDDGHAQKKGNASLQLRGHGFPAALAIAAHLGGFPQHLGPEQHQESDLRSTR